MTTDEPHTDRCAAKCKNGGFCSNYPIDGAERCRMHGGTSPGAPTSNGNASKHDLYSEHEHLFQRLSDGEKEHVVELAEDLIETYEAQNGESVGAVLRQKLKNAAIDIHKETLADNYLAKKSEEDESLSLLTEQYVLDTREDGTPITAEQPNRILRDASNLRTDTRMLLKDMSLLASPERKEAEAAGDVASAMMADLKRESGYS